MDDLNRELQIASSNGDIDKVRSMIERGADVNSRDVYGATALDWACYLGLTALASLLIERGADVHSKDNEGRIALHMASNNGQTAIASLLIEGGADVHSKDNEGRIALHFACMHDHKGIASLLIERGSKVDSRDNDGQTALHMACRNCQEETVILLIRSKADIYIQDNDGRAPLDYQPMWREDLTQLYEEIKNRDWLARNAFLLVLIGCNHIESESNKHNASKQTQSERESEEISDELRALRDRVLGNRDLLGLVPGTGIFSFL